MLYACTLKKSKNLKMRITMWYNDFKRCPYYSTGWKCVFSLDTKAEPKCLVFPS